MRALLAFVLVVQSGCALGIGSAYVGQWRQHRQVEYTACVIDNGRCDPQPVTTDVPARKFWGTLVTFPAAGIAGASDGVHLRLETALEYMRGYDRFAVGVRAGVQLDLADKTFTTALPVTVLGHYSLSDRLAIYGGPGYVPGAWIGDSVSHIGATGVAGIEYGLGRDLDEHYVILSLEASTTWIDLARPYTSTGVTATLGLFL